MRDADDRMRYAFTTPQASLTAVLTLVVLSGVIHGVWSDRWQMGSEPAVWAERLDNVPREIAGWRSQDLSADPNELKIAELSGALFRRYVHGGNQGEITVAILCGRAGPISVHTPDICFPGGGQQMLGTPLRYTLPEDGAEFRTARFRRDNGGNPTVTRVFWSWSADGVWKAPRYPRLGFAQAPALFKLYVIRPLPTPDLPPEKDAAEAFLQKFMPELRSALFLETDL